MWGVSGRQQIVDPDLGQHRAALRMRSRLTVDYALIALRMLYHRSFLDAQALSRTL